jgi:hypothetical protein
MSDRVAVADKQQMLGLSVASRVLRSTPFAALARRQHAV